MENIDERYNQRQTRGFTMGSDDSPFIYHINSSTSATLLLSVQTTASGADAVS